MTRFLFRNSRSKDKKSKNVIRSSANREYWDTCHHRENLRILRNLVLAENVIFNRVFEKTSSRAILYEGDRLFLDNHRTCMIINGRHGKPGPLFTLPPCSNKEKIEDVLICEATLASIPLDRRGWRHCLVAVTGTNHLVRYDLDTGEELERIYLHNQYQFRYLSMEDEAETIVIRSKHMTQESSNVYKAVIMFTIFPLEFVCMLEIERKIFGRDIQDCMLYQGLMINKHANGYLRFYDFNAIREKYTLFKSSVYGHHPDVHHTTGLPVNIKITETPVVLFEIKCYNHDLHIGGSPWQYIQAQGPAQFLVHLMDVEHQLTPGLSLGDGVAAIESDRAMFHPDDSGRIIHLTSHHVSVYKMLLRTSGPVLDPCFTINASDAQVTPSIARTENQLYTMTSSGRRSRKVVRDDVVDLSNEVTLDGLDYEDELELATACHVTQTPSDSYQARLCFYDNVTGDLVKEMILEEEWDEFGEHLVVLDRDSIIHIVKTVANKYKVYVYKMARLADDTVGDVAPKNLTSKRGRRRKQNS